MTENELKKFIAYAIEKLTRKYKENIYKNAFKIPEEEQINRFAYLRTVRGKNYYYINTIDKERKQRTRYLCKEYSPKAMKIAELEEEALEYKQKLIQSLASFLNGLRERDIEEQENDVKAEVNMHNNFKGGSFMSIKESLTNLFEGMAAKYPSFKTFIQTDCMNVEPASIFDLTETTSKIPWFPYLKVSSGSEHDVVGSFFYTRPAWNGDAGETKYRYLEKTVDFYTLAKAIYNVEYNETAKKITARFLPKNYQPRPGCRVYTVRVVYLAVYIKEIDSFGIVALEGVRTKSDFVKALHDEMRNKPLKLTMQTTKVSGAKGVYWSMMVTDKKELSPEELPFLDGNPLKELIKDIGEYYNLNLKLREVAPTTTSEEAKEEGKETIESPDLESSSQNILMNHIEEDEDDVPF